MELFSIRIQRTFQLVSTFGETIRKRYLSVFLPVFSCDFGDKRFQHGFFFFAQFFETYSFTVHG